MKSGKKDIQIPFNLISGGVICNTIASALCKQGVANVLPLKEENQHYTSFLIVDEKTNSN